MSTTVYDVITSRIIQALDAGVCPWRQPWAVGAPCNYVSRKNYRGINIFLLNASRFSSRYWLTYKQAAAKGGNVKKGEKSTPCVFWKFFEGKETADGGKERGGAILRYYSLFNLSQTEGIEIPEEETHTPFAPIEACERIIANYSKGPRIEHGGGRACYSPSEDLIQLPAKESFHSVEAYYNTLFHEQGHATGAASRLDREGVTNPIKFGSHDYSVEELTAEMCASFLAGEAGILEQTFENSAAYLSNWVSRLQRNPRWVVQAGSAAAKAADFILQRGQSAEQEDYAE